MIECLRQVGTALFVTADCVPNQIGVPHLGQSRSAAVKAPATAAANKTCIYVLYDSHAVVSGPGGQLSRRKYGVQALPGRALPDAPLVQLRLSWASEYSFIA